MKLTEETYRTVRRASAAINDAAAQLTEQIEDSGQELTRSARSALIDELIAALCDGSDTIAAELVAMAIITEAAE